VLTGLALAIVASVGCATATSRPAPAPTADTTPASPTPRAPDPSALVAYRDLTRDDFRATSPPSGADRARGHVAAATCAYLVPSPELRFKAVRKPGEVEFESGAVGLAFSARMDPACSWWDAESRFRPDDYVLEHEQIHFALVELVARDLNRRSEEIGAELRAYGETGPEALGATRQKFETLFQDAVRRVTERSQRFDRETSLGFAPEAQAEWAARIAAELEASENPATR